VAHKIVFILALTVSHLLLLNIFPLVLYIMRLLPPPSLLLTFPSFLLFSEYFP
jgi:hypothetical protein